MPEATAGPIDLSRRQRLPERMDDPALPPAEHARALLGLQRINWLTDSAGLMWPELRRLARDQLHQAPGMPLRVLDLGCGGGDVLAGLAVRARRSGLPFAWGGADVSPTALEVARQRLAKLGIDAAWHRWDALADAPPAGYDAIVCTLFLHHFDDADAAAILRRAGAAVGKLLLVNDLERGRLNYAMVWFASHALSGSPVVRHDGPISVRAAWTIPEAKQLAAAAGLAGASVARRPPARWLLAWRKAESA